LATNSQQRFVERALRRKKLFLALSIVGIVIAGVMGAYYGFRRLNDPTYPFPCAKAPIDAILAQLANTN